ncbi:hypothetical protein L1987_66569 [Smallanthus sonchifolius]|uniref:Uncharacterized protein n=1 Tax=Smallanthus sonchifolius TaxID=185202 RepID=A0ACB9BXT5_9ASTR|nr:hypothetical protein L1987_66569 [Smallanthus sonchifolius]
MIPYVDVVKQFYNSCKAKEDTEISDRFSELMVWIGIYIAIMSFFCILAMAADLLLGFRNNKSYFPCKYFSLTAASITVITVTMKLPVDLSSAMPSYIDQAAKLGSLAFMCTIMANIMPSLASLDNKTLLSNLIVEKLRQHVRRHWAMAETGSPQFVLASNPLSASSGTICLLILLINLFFVTETLNQRTWASIAYESQYRWSTTVIFVTPSIGVMVGTIAPALRCYSIFSFKLVTKENKNHFMVFKVEKYWTQKLHEWKQSHVSFLSSTRRSRSFVYNSKNIILSLCIGFQKVIVVSCKVIWFIQIVVPIFVAKCLYHWKLLKARWFTQPISSRNDHIDEDLSSYVLQINNEMELAENILQKISNSINSCISKAAKEQNNNLLELLEKYNGFKGVEIVDTDHVRPLLPVELVNSWSLPIVTLTCIVVALPNIPKDKVENLFNSVGEGLSYTHLVEESLNCATEYVTVRKASMSLWNEVENKCKWWDTPLAKTAFKGKTTTNIIKWFSDKAKEIVIEINESTNGEPVENPPKTLIAANSMYRITQTLLLRYQSNVEPITKKQLFNHLNGMIADIFSACFTNIPRVISMKCHEIVIEKRETSVKVATKLLDLKVVAQMPQKRSQNSLSSSVEESKAEKQNEETPFA